MSAVSQLEDTPNNGCGPVSANMGRHSDEVPYDANSGTASVLGLGGPKACYELLGINDNSTVKKVCEKQRLLLRFKKIFEFAQIAINDFIAGKLDKFDPHVGDTACQIRAYMVYRLYRESELGQYLPIIAKLRASFMQISNISILNDAKLGKNHDIKIKDFLTYLDLLFEIDAEVVFIVISKLLTSFASRNEQNLSLNIDLSSLAVYFQESERYVTRMVTKLQQVISGFSCRFVHTLASSHRFFKNHANLLFYQELLDSNHRKVLPIYPVTDLIINDLKDKEGWLAVVAHLHSSDGISVVKLFYKYVNGRFKNIHVQVSAEADVPCIVAEGIVSQPNLTTNEVLLYLKSAIGVYGLDKLIMFNVAAHPQYSGEKLIEYKNTIFPNQPDIIPQAALQYLSDYHHNVKLSVLIGCSFQNESTLLLKHMYCTMLSKVDHKYMVTD